MSFTAAKGAVAEQPSQLPTRLLIVGDSTGAGVGVEPPGRSLPALLAAQFDRAQIVNRCRSGALVSDTLAQVPDVPETDGTRFDMALVFAGGNDVLRLTSKRTLQQSARDLLAALKSTARHVVWIGCADIGVAPAVLPPVSWWLGSRARRAMRALGEVAAREGADFIDFCETRHTEVFASDPAKFFARDGLHPSAAAHRYCFETFMHRLHGTVASVQ